MHKNGNIAIRGYTTWKPKNIQWQMLGIEPGPLINLWYQVQHSSFWTKLTFACNTETLGSLYSHALLILTESSKSKNQVVHKQKFKDLLSSTCLVSPERIMLDLQSEVLRGPVSIPTDCSIFHCFFCFHIAKPLMPIAIHSCFSYFVLEFKQSNEKSNKGAKELAHNSAKRAQPWISFQLLYHCTTQ